MAKVLRMECCHECRYYLRDADGYDRCVHPDHRERVVTLLDTSGVPMWCPLPDADAPAWVPVTPETMPQNGVIVMLWWQDTLDMGIGYWSVTSRWRSFWPKAVSTVAPTHWRPLPAPPEVGE